MGNADGPLAVVGIDGSDHSRRALDWGLEYARRTGGRVHLVSAWEIPMGPWSATGAALDMVFARGYDFASSAQSELDRLLSEWIPEDPGVPVEAEATEGNPARVLMDVARDLDADVLVVGSRGRGGFTGLLLGSVSQTCVAHSTCPVVVVR